MLIVILKIFTKVCSTKTLHKIYFIKSVKRLILKFQTKEKRIKSVLVTSRNTYCINKKTLQIYMFHLNYYKHSYKYVHKYI